MPRTQPNPKRIYRYHDLRPAGVPFTRKHINTLEGRGEFPKRLYLTPFSIGWVAAEVDSWVEEKIRRRGADLPLRSGPASAAHKDEHRAPR